MRNFWLSLILFSSAYANLEPHLRKSSQKPLLHQIPHIDAIYLINLDERPEKWERSFLELRPFGIQPCRFSAINGWSLSLQALEEVGVRYQPKMASGLWALTPDLTGLKYDFIQKEGPAKTFFACWGSLGAIGCTLSHLSVLKQAYESGYEAVWVMEDDIQVRRDPNQLGYLIEKLDAIDPDWDVLYTDLDSDSFPPLYEDQTNFETDLKGNLWFFWRPDLPDFDRKKLAQRQIVSQDFLKIGSRMRTHSMILRRNGIKKILDFEHKHHTFIPYDHEIALVPDIRLYSLRRAWVTFSESQSDTKNRPPSPFERLVQQLTSQTSQPQKLQSLLEILYRLQPDRFVEVGANEGWVSYSVAALFRFLMKGSLWAVDLWDKKNPKKELLFQRFLHRLIESDLENLCKIVRSSPIEAASQFTEESIDFLYFKGQLEELASYFPKIKSGGYIWLDDTLFFETMPALRFLMEQCDWDRTYLKGIDACLFKKR